MNHDIDDALRAGILRQSEIPRHITDTLGATSRERINFLAHDFIEYSTDKDEVSLTPEIWKILTELRTFLFENVYAIQLKPLERQKIQSMIGLLFEYYQQHTDELPPEITAAASNSAERAACDHIANMTDRYAMKRFEALFMPSAWQA
jgi:dGTPase